jgi:tetratricopeptide (TPR) repeat protein
MDVRAGMIVPQRLDLDQLRDLREDIRHIMDGTRDFRFAVDAYDILRFCFPVGPFAGSRFRRSLDEHADYAAGMSFIFLRDDLRAILLPEYLEEVHFFVASFSRHYDGTYGDQDLVSTIESEAAAVAPELTELIRTHSTNFVPEEVISRYTSLLMYLSGAEAARVGFTALQRLVSQNLRSFTSHEDPRIYAPVDQVLHRLARKYEQNTVFIEQCLRAFKGIFSADEDESNQRDSVVLRRNYNDAVALDRVIQLNAGLDAEHQSGVPQRVYLLSSSVRLQRLVTALTEDVRWASGFPYTRSQLRVLRVPEQSFGYVIARPDVRDKSDEAAMKVLDSLERLVLIYERHKILGAERHRDPEAEREYHLLERNMREVLAPFQDSYENVALFNRLILVAKLIQQVGGSAHLLLRETGETGRFLRKLIDDAEVGVTARNALDTKRELVRFRTILTHRWCVVLEDGAAQDVVMAQTPDNVRGAYHALPWLIPTPTPALARVLELAREAFFLHPDEVGPRRRKLSDAFAALIQLDSGGGLETLEDAALDLIRAVLFLALRDHTTEEAALSLAQSLAHLGPELFRLDATYVQVWANRRSGNFEESVRLADYGTRVQPNDPRFWHGRALANYSLNRQDRNELLYTLARADLQKALDLYWTYEFASPELKRVTIAGCQNSLAYAWTLDVGTRGYLVEARRALNELKLFLGREKWEQEFPEFFHTEATLELREAEMLPAYSREWEQKLNWAFAAARRARDLAPTRTQYNELCEQIAVLLRDRKARRIPE